LGINLSKKDEPDDDDDDKRDDNKDNKRRDPNLTEDFSSPLILDLNRNGSSSTPLFGSKTYFDMDGDGFKEKTAWVQEGDGLLALDRNNNGTIDNGSELFGNFTPLGDGSCNFAINNSDFITYKEAA